MSLLDMIVRRGTALTTPFLPDDYLALLNPLWSSRELRGLVVDVRPEAAGAATLTIRPGRGWAAHAAGQWVGVGVEVDGVRHWRSYSLTGPVREDGLITITVKEMGRVSRHLVRRAHAGTVLFLKPAAGDFVLPAAPTRAPLFLTAGSGITPVMGMLRSRRMTHAVHLHSARTRDHVIFGTELRGYGHRFLERHTATDGVLVMAELDQLVPDWRNRETWVCGPAGLLSAAADHWAAAGLSHLLHVEHFTPVSYADPDATGGQVSYGRTGRTADTTATPSTTLLDAGEAAGVLMPSGCRMGICFGCVVPLLSGQVRDQRTGAVHGEPGDLVQTCISSPAGPCALDA